MYFLCNCIEIKRFWYRWVLSEYIYKVILLVNRNSNSTNKKIFQDSGSLPRLFCFFPYFYQAYGLCEPLIQSLTIAMQFHKFVRVKTKKKYLVSWAPSCYMSLVLLSFGLFLRIIRHFKMPDFFSSFKKYFLLSYWACANYSSSLALFKFHEVSRCETFILIHSLITVISSLSNL